MPKKGRKKTNNRSTQSRVEEELPRRSSRIAAREESPDWRGAGECPPMLDGQLEEEMLVSPHDCPDNMSTPLDRFRDRNPYDGLPEGDGDFHPQNGNPRRRGTQPNGAAGNDNAAVTTNDIAALAAALVTAVRPNKNKHKTPVYRGEGDVEMYINHFDEVAVANQWTPIDTLINLRSSLEGPARDCGGANTIQGVYDALRTRFGVAPKQARERLRNLRKSPKTSLSEFAVEVERLIGIAYSSASADERLDMSIDSFIRGLEPRSLQVFLLARRPATMKDAITAVEEFSQIGPSTDRPKAGEVWVDNPPQTAVAQAQSNGASNNSGNNEIARMLRSILSKLNAQGTPAGGTRPRPAQQGSSDTQTGPCYRCGGPHLRRFCPQQNQSQRSTSQSNQAQAPGRGNTRPVGTSSNRKPGQGNGQGPSRH